MLPADVYARFMRAQGHEVLFFCATDDHGTPAELAAAKKGQDVSTFCQEQHEIQKDIYARFGLSFDHFGATSRPENHELTQHIARKLQENGYFEVRSIEQLYSHTDGRFLPDRYVEGTCPHCGYDKARGDQCENCTKVLDPTDLVNPRSAISGSTELEVRKTSHLYLRLDKAQDSLRTWVESKTDWPQLTKSIALKWLDEGLAPRAMTRDLNWGIPVPTDTFGEELAGKVFYVWFDAPIGYIGATKEWANKNGQPEAWQDWWQSKDVTYTEFMGKDNVPFHTIIFPAMLMGTGEPWTLVDHLKSFSWLTYYGGKFSTSQGLGVFTDQALELLPADLWRYYLMSRVPESDDSSFTWQDLQAVVNKDLADVLGNFVNRTVQFSLKKYGEKIPTGGTWGVAEDNFAKDLTARFEAYTKHMNAMEFRKALHELREIWARGNEYLATVEPWQTYKNDPDQAALQLRTALNAMPLFAAAAAPIIPTIAAKVMTLFGNSLPTNWPTDITAALQASTSGQALHPLEGVLIQKLEDDQIAAWAAHFGGAQAAA